MHGVCSGHRYFAVQTPGQKRDMLRKLLWTSLYGAIGAAATMAARRLASNLYRIITGEAPPARR